MVDLADKYPSPHWTLIRQRVALAGVVSDGVSGAPIVGALVEITSGPKATRQTTRADGSYVFSGLPAENYSLSVSPPAPGNRYGTASDAVTVTETRDADSRLAVTLKNLALPPTCIHGTVRGKPSGGDAAPLAGARVQARGSGFAATTDDQGRYALGPLEAGKLTLEFFAKGFQNGLAALSLTAGNDLAQDITLEFEVPPKKTNGG